MCGQSHISSIPCPTKGNSRQTLKLYNLIPLLANYKHLASNKATLQV